jgi:hypothetical protein
MMNLTLPNIFFLLSKNESRLMRSPVTTYYSCSIICLSNQVTCNLKSWTVFTARKNRPLDVPSALTSVYHWIFHVFCLLYGIYVMSQNINISSIGQKLMCPTVALLCGQPSYNLSQTWSWESKTILWFSSESQSYMAVIQDTLGTSVSHCYVLWTQRMIDLTAHRKSKNHCATEWRIHWTFWFVRQNCSCAHRTTLLRK